MMGEELVMISLNCLSACRLVDINSCHSLAINIQEQTFNVLIITSAGPIDTDVDCNQF